MHVESPSAPGSALRPLPLRRNFAWTLSGNVVYGASQWAVLSLIAKLGSTVMLGQYALAVAVAAPVAMLSHLNLRAVLATDVERRHPFGDYIAVRLATAALALAVIAGIAFASGYATPVPALILLVGIALTSENITDIYYGPMQRAERMDRVARSTIARGLLPAAALGLALWFTRNLIAAAASLAAARIAVLLIYDRPRGSQGEDLSRTGFDTQFVLLRTALPLGIVLMLISLTANMPRYAIEHHLGLAQLGAFSAVASFIAAGSTIMNALGQSATPRLARLFSAGDLAAFRRLALRLAALAASVGAAGVLVSAVAGKVVLSTLYRREYEVYAGLLTTVMGAAVPGYIAVALGYALTSARAFSPQMPLVACAAAASGIASWVFVPRLGLWGAALALALAGAVQIAGAAGILRSAVRARRRAA